MNLTEEIKKPSHQSEPDFLTGKRMEKRDGFKCSDCENRIEIDFQR